jgi:superfamily II helicase
MPWQTNASFLPHTCLSPLWCIQTELRHEIEAKTGRTVARGCKLVDYYHAERTSDERKAIQGAWMNGDIRILAATVAFGMGIDKPDVRWVFHHSLSKSLEGKRCSFTVAIFKQHSC